MSQVDRGSRAVREGVTIGEGVGLSSSVSNFLVKRDGRMQLSRVDALLVL